VRVLSLRRGLDEAIMAQNDINPIDLVVVNLYPFQATIANPDCSLEDAIENIVNTLFSVVCFFFHFFFFLFVYFFFFLYQFP
jgi:hypothetical protein